MMADGFTLFETAVGRCAVAWSERGLTAVHLPEAGDEATRARVRRRCPRAVESTPPLEVQLAIDSIVRLLAGEHVDLSTVRLDMTDVPDFHQRVYDAARAIGPGTTRTYGDLARTLGSVGASRAVGQALGRNPFVIVVPCHRVLAAGDRLGGFSANGGVKTKARLLAIEGVRRADVPPLLEASGALPYDPHDAVRHLREVDPALGRLIDAVGPCRLELDPAPNIFVALAESIVYQQLTGRAAATIYARVCALFPRSPHGPSAEQMLHIDEAMLRGAGLSRAKLLALRDLARHAIDGTIPRLADIHALTDDDIVERLTIVRGIGRWTVEMLLIFRLGRPDVLPVDDYGVRKGFAAAFGKRSLPTPQQLARRGARWKPYRSVASWYLWRAADARDG